MKAITCASYYGTGSSAVTDFVAEFDGVKSLTDFEFRFAHDPDGLSELEYNVVENFNRHNSGHALKRYQKLVDYNCAHFMAPRYDPFFHGQWKKLSYEYLEKLTQFTFPGSWQYDYYDEGAWFEFWHKLPNRLYNRLLHKQSESTFGTMKNCITYASHLTEEEFLTHTRAYTDALLAAANPEKLPVIMLDQLLPSSNIPRHMRYFTNLQAVVVDRDPRDQYLLGKYVWNSEIIPKDIPTFCQWYDYCRSTRGSENWDEKAVKLIQFEDLIYRYDQTTRELMDWLGLDASQHKRPRQIFNPDLSIKNTRLWEQNPAYRQEAEEIARRLPEYLYEPE